MAIPVEQILEQQQQHAMGAMVSNANSKRMAVGCFNF